MLDQLVESKSNTRENTRRSEFLLITLFVMVASLLTGWTYSLFAKDYGMGGDDLSLTTLVAPVPVPDEEPPPKPEKEPEKQLNVDVRKELVASIDMSPKEPPPVSTARNNVPTIRKDYDVVLGDKDSNASGPPVGSGRVVDTGTGGGSGLPTTTAPDPNADAPPPPPPPKKEPPKTVSGGVLNGKATSLPKPAYPPAAKAVQASGSVSVQVLIDEGGRVVSASAVSGHPLLRSAAVAAARGARFSPTLLSGQAVKVSGVITYNFVP